MDATSKEPQREHVYVKKVEREVVIAKMCAGRQWAENGLVLFSSSSFTTPNKNPSFKQQLLFLLIHTHTHTHTLSLSLSFSLYLCGKIGLRKRQKKLAQMW